MALINGVVEQIPANIEKMKEVFDSFDKDKIQELMGLAKEFKN